MKILKKHILYFVCAGILFELFFGLGVLVSDSVKVIHTADIAANHAFVEMRTEQGADIMSTITNMGDYEFVLHITVILGLLMAVFGHIEISLGIISSIALTSYYTGELKNYFHRFRPDDYLIKTGGWSYPSGHTSASSILAIMIIWAAFAAIPKKKYRWLQITITVIAAIYAVSVAVSRLYLGVHWFSDVVGGALLAGSIGVLMMGILKPVIMKRKSLC